MEKYFLFVLNCKKYRGKRLVQTQTWLKDFPINYCHVIGDETLETIYKYDNNNKILYVKCKDTYECLPMKTFFSICAILELFPHVEYILKTDDGRFFFYFQSS